MADGAAKHKKMPDEVHIRNFVHDEEDDTERVSYAFRKKQDKTRVVERLAELRKGDDDHPAHDEIDWQRENVGPFRRTEAGDEYPCNSEAPLEAENRPACLWGKHHKNEWRVAARDQQEDSTMVENLEDTFRTKVREGVVEHGEGVEENQRRAEYGAASDVFRGSYLRGEDAHERQPDDAEDDADEMGDAVGPLLATATMELLQTHLKPAIVFGEFLIFLGWSGLRHFND